MRTRNSHRNQDRLFRYLFEPPKQHVELERPAYLDMSDAEIEEAYPHASKRARYDMRRAAAKERRRKLEEYCRNK